LPAERSRVGCVLQLLRRPVGDVPTVLTGLLAWQWELDRRRLKGILLLHLLSGYASLVLIASVWWEH